jgi:hypothetical protein
VVQYSDEFRRDAVALVRDGATQREVCGDLGVSKSTMSKWHLPPRFCGCPQVLEAVWSLTSYAPPRTNPPHSPWMPSVLAELPPVGV